jgi:NADH:ubiquinone oxidoreductase subunit E
MHSAIFSNYPLKDKSNLIGLLQDVQGIYGYLPESALQDISEFLGMPVSRI